MFVPVECPRCTKKIAEVFNGVSRVRCGKCKLIVTYGREEGGSVRIISVDKYLAAFHTRSRQVVRV